MAWITLVDQKKFKPLLLERLIRGNSNKEGINIEDVKPNKTSEIQEANDLFFVMNINNFSFSKLFFIIWFSMTLILYLTTFELFVILLTFPLLAIALWDLALNYLNPTKEIVLDRLNGTITYPKTFFYKTPNTVLFSEVLFFEKLDRLDGRYNTNPTMTRYKFLYLKHPNNKKKLSLSTVNIYNHKNGSPDRILYQEMSFFIWYMDKNRPLPPGTAFDSYRKNDFDRRRNEGFLAPLYPSTVKTKEANSYQEKVKSDFLK